MRVLFVLMRTKTKDTIMQVCMIMYPDAISQATFLLQAQSRMSS